ncbi:unnamed protein product [Chrysoparadoxa australica]
MADQKATIICDNGSGFVKVGYAGDNFPTTTFPSLIGRPSLRGDEVLDFGKDAKLKGVMCGDEAAALRAALEISYPIENGVVRNWEDMESLWRYTFEEKLKIDPSERRILLTEPPMNPLRNREKMAECMFEKFGFDSLNVSIQAVLTLYAQGLQRGVVLDSGDGVTHCVPVYDGFVPQHLIRRLDVAGRHVTGYLIKLLLLRGYAFNRTADYETVREMKEKLCYAAADIDMERKLAQETTVLEEKYELPDGRVVQLGRERSSLRPILPDLDEGDSLYPSYLLTDPSQRFEAPECLFNPSLLDCEQHGMAEMVYDMIQSADIDTRMDYYKHIVLSGGTTMYPGLPTRLEKDIKQHYLDGVLKGDTDRMKKFRVHIEDPPRRKNLVFIGGSVVADVMRTHEEFWISKDDWEESGAKCLSKFSPTM